MYFSIQILMYTPLAFTFLYLLVNYIAKTPKNVCIVVLGDIGRSPRMQYHALSFAREGFKLYIVGYKGSTPLAALLNNDQISLHYLKEPPVFFKYFPRLLTYFLKVVWQSLVLTWTLLLLPKTSSTLIQNPPSIPTMLVTYIVCRVRSSQLVTDWHNYGHTILALALSHSHPLVKFSKWYEKVCGQLSDHNICVTKAMKRDLKDSWNVRAVTVYDRPPEMFRSISLPEQHSLFIRLSTQYKVFNAREASSENTVFTQKSSGGVVRKLDDRPALLVSSTSWTEDEDFGILLNALKDYEENAEDAPDLICVITGKGPQKEHYRKTIAEMEWKRVKFCLPWLAAEDYPLLLGSADVGVSLHTSSSGLDLPMKVVDMFGCGLPVCAANFQCINELVCHGENGLVFNSSQELATQLKDLLFKFPKGQEQLKSFCEKLKPFQSVRWHEQWKEQVLPIFEYIGGDGKRVVLRDMKNEGGISDDFDELCQEGGGDGARRSRKKKKTN